MKARLLLLSLVMLPSGAFAGASEVARMGSAASAPDASLSTGFAGSSIIVKADSDSSDASITLSRSRDYFKEGKLGFRALTFKVAVPLETDKKNGLFVTDSGLVGVNAFEISWNWLRAPSLPNAPDPQGILADAAAECAKDPTASAEACTSRNSETLRRWMTPTQAAQMFPPPKPNHKTEAFTVTAGVGAKKYKFRDITSLDKDEAARTPWNIALQYGFAGPNDGGWASGWYSGLGFEAKRTYEEPTSRTLCQPQAVGQPLECFTGAYERPKEKKSALLFGLLRKQNLIDTLDVSWALQLKPAYDFETQAAGLEATLYFDPDKSQKLRGGLRGKLQTRDDDPATDDEAAGVELFVGAAF